MIKIPVAVSLPGVVTAPLLHVVNILSELSIKKKRKKVVPYGCFQSAFTSGLRLKSGHFRGEQMPILNLKKEFKSSFRM